MSKCLFKAFLFALICHTYYNTIYTHGLDGALTDTDSVAVGEELADLKWRFPPLRSFLIIERRERRRVAQRMAQR